MNPELKVAIGLAIDECEFYLKQTKNKRDRKGRRKKEKKEPWLEKAQKMS